MNDLYRLIPTSEAREQLDAVLQWARAADRIKEFADALLWTLSELERTPLEFGEGQYAAEDIHEVFKMRTAFVGPLMVRFTVRSETRRVFVTRIRPWF